MITSRAALRPHSESGFAVLMIYSMAVIIAIMLFMQIPRVAFEAQRDREQLLIDRGQQYIRGIQLYVRKFNKFPPDFDALNNTQNLRFLRRKYKDPMTGKDDWRIIHAGPGGALTDSLIQKKKADDSKLGQAQNFITELQPLSGPPDGNQNINIGTRQRQSDQAGAPGDPNNPVQPPQVDANGNPIQLPPGAFPIAGQQPGAPGFPGQPQFNANGTPTAPGQPFPGQYVPNQYVPGQSSPNPAFPNQPFPNQPGIPNQPYQANTGVPPDPNQPPGTAGAPTGAAALINQLLTTPRPGGLSGVAGAPQTGQQGTTTGTPIAQAAGQTVVGGGIAGVASKLEEDGIKVYNDQTSYHKWEFVYDIAKDPARGGGAIPAANAQANPNGQNPNGPNPAAVVPAAAPMPGTSAGGYVPTPGPGAGAPIPVPQQ